MFWLNQAYAQSFMPPQATEIATMYDKLYGFLVIISLISSLMVIGGLIYFVVKYKRKSENDKTAYIPHNATLEFLWSFIPFVLFMVCFGWGWLLFHKMRSMPTDALEVHVVGQKWNWDFIYKSGKKSSGEFYVPVNKKVKLIMSSRDVLHSFFIPAFRIKQDVVPGRYTTLWFEANKLGSYQVFCTEYCGDQHSAMLAKVHVIPEAEYEEWLQNNPYKGLSLAEVGQKVYAAKCVACHSVGDNKVVGPGFKGLFGKERAFVTAEAMVADETYVRESIIQPNAKIVTGYPKGVMPTFAGQLTEQELTGVVEYLKTLK